MSVGGQLTLLKMSDTNKTMRGRFYYLFIFAAVFSVLFGKDVVCEMILKTNQLDIIMWK